MASFFLRHPVRTLLTLGISVYVLVLIFCFTRIDEYLHMNLVSVWADTLMTALYGLATVGTLYLLVVRSKYGRLSVFLCLIAFLLGTLSISSALDVLLNIFSGAT